MFVSQNKSILHNQTTAIGSSGEDDQTGDWKRKEFVLLYIRECRILHIHFAYYELDGLSIQEAAGRVSPFLDLFAFEASVWEVEWEIEEEKPTLKNPLHWQPLQMLGSNAAMIW